MNRRNAMHRPPRLRLRDPVASDEDAATCSARASQAALSSRAATAGVPARPRLRSGISERGREDRDVVSSLANDPDSVTSFAARPSYVARGEIRTAETPTYARPIPTLDSSDLEPCSETGPDFALRYPNADAYAPTEAFAAVGTLEERAFLARTREEPLVAPSERSFENEPAFVAQTMLMPSPSPSVRAPYRSQMSSVPPSPESWVESPWVMPSTRSHAVAAPSVAAAAATRDPKNVLQTIAVVGTGVLMLAIVFGAVLFARSDGEERMQFSAPHALAATSFPAPRAAPLATPPPTARLIAASPVPVSTNVSPAMTTTPPAAATARAPAALGRAKELPPRTRADASRTRAEKVERTEKTETPPKKTKEEESVEALLKKLGEEQLSR